VEERLPGGKTGGAVRVGDTVRRQAGPWTPAVHALLTHLHDVGFDRCVAHWLRDYHAAAATFTAPADAAWRGRGPSGGGTIICHNDAAPYNACWNDDALVGFFDWDFAGPGTTEWDLAFTASAWVPLHARHVALEEGFRAFDDRRRRLETFLAAYGWTGDVEHLVLETLRARYLAHIEEVERLAAVGDTFFRDLIAGGTVEGIREALRELPSVLLDPRDR
jgi:hypothetical protein